MNSDFAMARHHLERAYYYLCGDDDVSGNARTEIDTLMDDLLRLPQPALSEVRRRDPRGLEAEYQTGAGASSRRLPSSRFR